jgi:chromosomal replication initiator protein
MASDSLQQTWKACLARIATRVGREAFNAHFRTIRPLEMRRGESEALLRLQAPTQAVYLEITQRHPQIIEDAMAEEIGMQTRVVLIADPLHRGWQQELDFDRSAEAGAAQQAESVPNQLNGSYRFDNFIVGDGNRLAQSAATAIAGRPGGTSFNPFLVYGGVGLGKTHLVQAIGNEVARRGDGTRVRYVSSEQFTSEFVQSIQQNRTADFSLFYRQYDVLIVDDVQFFGGKEKTQEEFFHIFNALHQAGKQIILAADRPPKEISGIEDRLVSRFQWGLTVDIQPPDYETRLAILQHKAESEHTTMDAEVFEFIAGTVTANIRQLEGALKRLMAQSSLCNQPVTLDMARVGLRDLIHEDAVTLDLPTIQRTVADYFRIPTDLLNARTRKREIVEARQVAMFFSKQLTNRSLQYIGEGFGGRDHSTVIHACQVVQDRSDVEVAFRDNLAAVERLLRTRRSGGRVRAA